MQKSEKFHKDVLMGEVSKVEVLPEGFSFKPKHSRVPKKGLSGVSLDPEIVRNIGVAILERACQLADRGVTPNGLLWTTLKNLLANEIRNASADKRARYVKGGNREVSYDEIPGMANWVYSGGDLED